MSEFGPVTDDEASLVKQQLKQTVQRKPWKAAAASNVWRRFDPRAFVPERVNAQISKRYNIDSREVGAGGYGRVFVAEDKEIKGRVVAIKKVQADSREMRLSFDREVSLMKELDHPNICKILETYLNGRTLWVVMEYCEGGEVFDKIVTCGKIPENESADILRQVVGALLYAHNRGIAHRDLKPENVCFCEKGTGGLVKVIDWGVSCHFNAAGMRSAVGSTTYAAPEVLDAHVKGEYFAACDLWSFGVMAYVMLSGKPPFWGQPAEELRKMYKEQYPMHDALWQGISPDAKDMIRRLIRADPAKRLTIQATAKHPWLQGRRSQMDNGEVSEQVSLEVLTNMRDFSKTSHFFSICAASVAKQLDHKSLQDIQRVFSEMDINGDGVLELREVRAGFERIFGKDSEQQQSVEELFARLDLDGSGMIDYTEFCAAGIGIGERGNTERHANYENAIRAAFKSFDIIDDNGRVTKEEIKRVLQGASVGKAWSKKVCEQVVEELFDRFDTDGDGALDFQEWLLLMRESAVQRPCEKLPLDNSGDSSPEASGSLGGPTLLEGARKMRLHMASFAPASKDHSKDQVQNSNPHAGRSRRIFNKVSDLFQLKRKGESQNRVAESRNRVVDLE